MIRKSAKDGDYAGYFLAPAKGLEKEGLGRYTIFNVDMGCRYTIFNVFLKMLMVAIKWGTFFMELRKPRYIYFLAHMFSLN